MEFWQAIILSLGTGVFSAVSTVAALRTDIGWLKSSLSRAHARIDRVEDKLDMKVRLQNEG